MRWRASAVSISRRDVRIILDTIEQMETLPTIRRGLDALGMRSMLEWEFSADEIARTRSPFTHPMQRPTLFHPGVRAQMFHEPPSWIGRLEAAQPAIREELHGALAARSGFQPYRPNEASGGGWNLLYLHAGGGLVEGTTERFPRTVALLESIPRFRRIGISCFSAVNPGAEIAPHCGPVNGILRVHLCLEGARGAELRVGTERRTWSDGRALVFDDSFEHAVRHEGPKTRFVLFFEIWHPDWSDDEVARLETLHRAFRETQWAKDVDEGRRRDRDKLSGVVWWT
jgi:aspartate beta-hydroxylase